MLPFLLQGKFLTRERVRLWSIGLIAATIATIAYLALTAHGLNDYRGRPLGTDFSDVYTAGQLARDGIPEAAYDPARHYRQQQAVFGSDTPFYGWHYPPFFLVIASGLSNLAYIPALLLWQVLTFAGYWLAMRMLLRHGPAPELASDSLWLLAVLAFPAVFVNATHGQNGFLSAALLASGLALLGRAPTISGILFGLMAYKPQFGILLPVVLAAGGHWKAFAAAALTVLGLVALATISFGWDIWAAFFASGHFSRTVVLEQGSTGFEKIQSVFSAVRLLGGPIGLAYAMQALAFVAVAAALVWLWRGQASLGLKGAGLCLGALLSTPYCLDYDLMLLAPAIALLASEGRVRGFLTGEVMVLSGLWILPLVARGFAAITHVALAPILMSVCLLLLIKRAVRREAIAR